MGWTSIYQLFWCSPGVQGFDTLPYNQWWSAWWFQHVSAIFFDVKNRRNGMITLQWWASIVQRFKKKTQIEVVQDLTKVVVYIIYIYLYINLYWLVFLSVSFPVFAGPSPKKWAFQCRECAYSFEAWAFGPRQHHSHWAPNESGHYCLKGSER